MRRLTLLSFAMVVSVAIALGLGCRWTAVALAVWWVALLSSARFRCRVEGHDPEPPFSEAGRRWEYCKHCRQTLPHEPPKAPVAQRLSQYEIDGNFGCTVEYKPYNVFIAETVLAIDKQNAEPVPVPWPVGQVLDVPERVARAAGGLR